MAKEIPEKTLEVKHESYYCDICFDNRFVSMTAPCGHSTCGVCISKIFDHDNLNDTCALCRKQLPDTYLTYKYNFHDSNDLKAEEYKIAARGAVKEGKLDVLKKLLELGFDVKKILDLAAIFGQLEIVKFLAENGENVNKANANGVTPLHYAVHKGHIEIVKFLAKNGVHKGDENGATPILFAAQNGHIEIVKFLAENEADVNKADTDGATPIFLAAQNGHIEIVKFLAKNGANVKKADANAVTPLHLAVINDHIGVVKFLAENGANANKADARGVTPLHLAEILGHKEVVKILAENGARM